MAPTNRMQAIVMDAITERLDCDDLIIIVEPGLGTNVGIIRALPEGSFTSPHGMHYDLQHDHASLKPTKGSEKLGVYLNYEGPEGRLTDGLDRICQYLEGKA